MQEFLNTYFHGRVEQEFLQDGTYAIDCCVRCGGMWQREILDDAAMERLYAHWIHSGDSKGGRWNQQRSLNFARHCARLLRLLPEPKTRLLLDYGMGWGDWCHMAQSFGFKVHGTELSQERIEYAQSIGLPASLPGNLPPGPYDFIYLEQVLEHLPDPHAVIARLTMLLKPGGYIHIGVPNGATVASNAGNLPRLLKKGPAQPLEHINIFTHASLCRFLASFGCHPASQREGLIRAFPLRKFLSDVTLALARHLPASMFPKNTSLLFQKR